MKGAHLTFHLGEKNGGWGKYRDDYEGYNRLSRKMAESAMVGGSATCLLNLTLFGCTLLHSFERIGGMPSTPRTLPIV